MPIGLDALSLLISKQTPQQYEGGSAGKGMRERRAIDQKAQEAQLEAEGRRKLLDFNYAKLTQKQQQTDQERQDKYAKIWDAAKATGNPDVIESAAQELERIGFTVQRPEKPTASEVEPSVEKQTGTASPSASPSARAPVQAAEPPPEQSVAAKMPSKRAMSLPAKAPNPDAEFNARVDKALAGDEPPPTAQELIRRDLVERGDIPDDRPSTATPTKELIRRELVSRGDIPNEPPPAIAPPRRAMSLPDAASLPPAPAPARAAQSEELAASLPPKSVEPKAPPSTSWRVLDPSGKQVFGLNEKELKASQELRVKQHFDELDRQARSPQEKRAVSVGREKALAGLGEVPIDKAIENGQKAYQFEINGDLQREAAAAATTRAAMAHSPEEGDDKRKRYLFNQLRYKAADVEKAYKLPEVRKGLEDSSKVSSLVGSGSTLEERTAFTKQLQSMFKGATSDRELAYAQATGGLWGQLKQKFNYYTDRGQLTPEMVSELKALSLKTQAAFKRYLETAGEEVRRNIVDDSTMDFNSDSERSHEADRVKHQIMGFRSSDPGSISSSNSSSSDAPHKPSTAKPSGNSKNRGALNREAADLLK